MTAAFAVGILVAAGVYLILQRGLVRVTIGFVMLGHAANIVVIAAGGLQLRDAPLIGHSVPDAMADPLPQAFVLTAIVITFGITVYLLALARGGGEDDPGLDAIDPDAPDAPDEPDDIGGTGHTGRADIGHGTADADDVKDVAHITDDRSGTR